MLSAALVLTTMVGGGWTVIQIQFVAFEKHRDATLVEMIRWRNETNNSIDRINVELLRRNNIFTTNVTYDEYRRGVDQQISDIKSRLTFIEQTRPTTGELQGARDNATRDINRILDRVEKLEARIVNRPGG